VKLKVLLSVLKAAKKVIMKNWISGKYKLAAVAITAVVLSSTVGVLAYTNLDFSNKAREWQSANCTQKELNMPKAREQSAICYGIAGVEMNAVEIEAVKQAVEKSSGNDSIYTLLNVDTSNANVDAREGVIESMVPVDGVISSLTLLAKGGADKVIDLGRVDITVLVNGSDVVFGTYLDEDHTRNIALSNDIQVKAGDVLQVKIKNSDDLFTTGTTSHTCYPPNEWGHRICREGSIAQLNLNIGLYLKAK